MTVVTVLALEASLRTTPKAYDLSQGATFKTEGRQLVFCVSDSVW